MPGALSDSDRLIDLQAIGLRAGFVDSGAAKITSLADKSQFFQDYLDAGYDAGMGWLRRNVEKRLDPSLLVEGASTILCFLAPYGPGEGGVAGFALGEDYHKVIKGRLRLVAEDLKRAFPGFEGRVFTDSAPVFERYWARRANLGFIGLNRFLISPEYGLRTLIGTILCNIPFERFIPHPEPAVTSCGECGRCLEACPGGAITKKGIDASRCLSYLSIESPSPPPDGVPFEGNIFGCEACINCCPWDKPTEGWSEFSAFAGRLREIGRDGWDTLSEGDFKEEFKESGLLRAGLGRIRELALRRAGEAVSGTTGSDPAPCGESYAGKGRGRATHDANWHCRESHAAAVSGTAGSAESAAVAVKPTIVEIPRPENLFTPENRWYVSGSCFSTEMGRRLQEMGYDVCLNPFGILFNPASIAASLERLDGDGEFTEADVIVREGRFVSFHHHGSFAKGSPVEFLESAGEALKEARARWQAADTVMLTFGTSWVFRHKGRDMVVANCHKIPAGEFSREFLPFEDIVAMYEPLISRHREKRWIFTVSPIRHKADGLHGNQLSKANLLMAIERLQRIFPAGASGAEILYFPAYEILLDELRDYSWYAADGVHPSPAAVNVICSRFTGWLRRDACI